jgi:hypothetical protein
MGAAQSLAVVIGQHDVVDLDDLPPEDDYSWFFDAAVYKRYSPAERLRIAVLGDAMWCLQRKTSPAYCNSANFAIKRDRNEAKAWLNGEVDSPRTFSFTEICDLIFSDLAITENDVRAAILKAVKSRRFDIRELIFWLQ